MDQYEKERLIEKIFGVECMIFGFIVLPIWLIFSQNVGTLIGLFLIQGLIIVILKVIEGHFKPPTKYYGTGRGGSGWGVGGNQE